MHKGRSLHIGVRTSRPESESGVRQQELRGCERDAYAMRDIALDNRFEIANVLIDSDATFDMVEGSVRSAMRDLSEGDTFLWTFSGHGAQAPSGGIDNGYNEGMTLYDYIMLDNHINVLLRGFKPGVRIILVADCCNSGTISEVSPTRGRIIDEDAFGMIEPGHLNRLLHWRAAEDHVKRYGDHYAELLQRFARECAERELPDWIVADLVVLSATNETMRAADTPSGGVFTLCLRDALDGIGIPSRRPFRGSYRELIHVIHCLAHNGQMPEARLLGPHSENDSYPFFLGPPFSLNH